MATTLHNQYQKCLRNYAETNNMKMYLMQFISMVFLCIVIHLLSCQILIKHIQGNMSNKIMFSLQGCKILSWVIKPL